MTFLLNNNIGCIEMATGNWIYDLTDELNNNIGCIEIILTKIRIFMLLNNNMECIEIPTYLLCHF